MLSVEIYVFYFDLIGVADAFYKDPAATLSKLLHFQKESRLRFEFGNPHSYVVTLADNVCCRVNADEAGTPSQLLIYAGSVMSAAKERTRHWRAVPYRQPFR